MSNVTTTPAASTFADAFTEQDIEIPLMGEEVLVGKRNRVSEEIRLHIERITQQREVTDTVRKERVTIEGIGDLAEETTSAGSGSTRGQGVSQAGSGQPDQPDQPAGHGLLGSVREAWDNLTHGE